MLLFDNEVPATSVQGNSKPTSANRLRTGVFRSKASVWATPWGLRSLSHVSLRCATGFGFVCDSMPTPNSMTISGGGFSLASGDINDPISTNQTTNPHCFKPLTLTGGKFVYPWYNTEFVGDEGFIDADGFA